MRMNVIVMLSLG